MPAVTLVQPTEQSKARVISSLEEVINDVREGRVTGVVVLMEFPEQFGFKRTNVRLETAIALCARVGYRLNQEWDT